MRVAPIAVYLLIAVALSAAETQEVEKNVPVAEDLPAEKTIDPELLRNTRIDPDDESLFSDAEIGDLYAKATKLNERSEPKTKSTYAVENEGEIYELAPFTVESRHEQMVARVKREMERRPERVYRRLADIAPEMAHRAFDDARAQNAIFDQEPRIGPSGVPSTGGVTASQVGGALSDAIRAIFAKED